MLLSSTVLLISHRISSGMSNILFILIYTYYKIVQIQNKRVHITVTFGFLLELLFFYKIEKICTLFITICFEKRFENSCYLGITLSFYLQKRVFCHNSHIL